MFRALLSLTAAAVFSSLSLIAQPLSLALPADHPDDFTVEIAHAAGPLTLDLAKSDVFGANTRWLLDDGSGELKRLALGNDGAYLGSLRGVPGSSVSAVLSGGQLWATIVRPGQHDLFLTPSADGHFHSLEAAPSPDIPGKRDVTSDPPTDAVGDIAASPGAVQTGHFTIATNAADKKKSTATLKPERVMEVLEFEVGCEIGSRAFLADTYGADLKRAQAAAQSLVANLDRRYLHSAGVKHRLGTVIIRQDASTDPLRESVRRGDRKSLTAFTNYWNSHPDEVGTTHDMAVYHAYWAPSGIAWVNTVGGRLRYAISCGRGATSWADGTIAHEFGHTWNLHHNNKSGMFYENRPRRERDQAGGMDYHVSIMHGSGNHNIGRVATEEANMVYRVLNQRRKYGDLIEKPGPISPFGHRDIFHAQDGKAITMDVVANDFDCNNDVLDCVLYDTVSFYGGTIALSPGSGPGGRNELTYTPPSGFIGRDFFHYIVRDSTGRRDWGCVYVHHDGPVTVDTSRQQYNYDLGPATSTVQTDWENISPKTRGDISWSREVTAVDRGLGGGINDINRDLIFGEATTTLSHKLANGLWAVTLNLGDRTHAHDRMTVRAEGKKLGDPVDSEKNQFPYVEGKVTVTDGVLDLTFSDHGGDDPNWVVTRLSLQRLE